jgi:tRNA pseudouridine13 synthase
MSPGGWAPPERERALGLGFYATETAGIPGSIKLRPEDFRVREISSYPRPDPEGPHVVLRIETEDWEQHELAQRIASRLGLAPHALSWAGTKDRRAVSERLFSYRGPIDRAESAIEGLPHVRLREVYRARDGLALGHHYGNAFRIRIGRIALRADEANDRAQRTLRSLRELGRFPNFFGPQRFGEVRPVTHAVGRFLVRGDADAAVESYLTDLPPGEPVALGRDARRAYADHRDPLRALREFPPSLGFERRLLDRLARGSSPAEALGALPRELRGLFVHAYQALLFNRYLGERRALGLSDRAPEAGDFLLRVARDGTIPSRDPIPVSSDNRAEAEELVGRGRAHLAGPLVGYDTAPSSGRAGQALETVLEAEGVRREDFRLPARPELASRGAWRPLSMALPPVSLGFEPSDPGPDVGSEGAREGALLLSFALPKGVYATVLLREFLKEGATRVLGAAEAPISLASNRA